MRYFLDISYLGTHYHGWQIQENAHTLQAEIESKLAIILQKPTPLTASGRTDSGVHAFQQMAHIDSEKSLTYRELAFKLNAMLPSDIAIRHLYQVDDQAHARFDATQRSYQYHIFHSKNPFRENQVWFNHRRYDLDRMNEAAAQLLNFEDFQCFSKVKTDVNHFLCRIDFAKWETQAEGLVFHIKANRFLRGMVRAIVGTLLKVGSLQLTLPDFVGIIESKDRRLAGESVPPQGLYLSEVSYPYPLIQAD